MQNAEPRYQSALDLYRTTKLSVKAICEQTGTPLTPFKAYLRRCHRDLLFARYGISATKEEASKTKLRKKCGQSAAAHAKYKAAIEACDSIAYIEFNVSQIAYLFHLNPSALSNQLRNHYPEILQRRENVRHRLGVNDNLHRGVKQYCTQQYAEAVERLRTTDETIRQAAEICNVSYTGLREHLLYYHKDLIRERADKRERAKTDKVRGGLAGNGKIHEPTQSSVDKYREAVLLYRDTAMTLEEICDRTGTSLVGLRYHLRTWNKDLVMERRDVDGRMANGTLSTPKRYLRSTAAKYAEAILRLKSTGRPVAEVAKEFGLNPESFRTYLHEHEPELAAGSGMTRLDNGRLALASSAEKYKEAVRLYETTTESLKSIARRLGLQYNSVGGFVRRSRPDAIEAHNRLLEQAEKLRMEKEQAESAALAVQKEKEEKEHILRALEQTGGHKRNAAKLLGISKSALYNKLKAHNIDL